MRTLVLATLLASACATVGPDSSIGHVALGAEESVVLVDSLKQSDVTKNLNVQSISCQLELEIARCSVRNETFGERVKIEPKVASQLAKMMLRHGARLPGENSQGGVQLRAEAVRCEDSHSPRCTLIVSSEP